MARERLVSEHLSEVRFIARKIHARLPGHVPLEDLVHAGVIGLIDAVDKFDPLKQVQLKSYAKFRIRGAILDSLRAADWSPRSLRRQARLLDKAQRDIAGARGRSATENELAEYLGLDLLAFHNLMTELRGLEVGSLQSLRRNDQQEENLAIAQTTASAADPFSICLRAEMKSHLAHAVGELEKREQEVLALYYSRELTMKEVGQVLGIGESRVCQIHSAALGRLRDRLQLRLKCSLDA